MSVEAVAPSGEGPGPGDGTAADFCHIGWEIEVTSLYETHSLTCGSG